MSYWVVDANIAVQSALNISDGLERFWERINDEQITPCSPRLWMSETTSAVRSTSAATCSASLAVLPHANRPWFAMTTCWSAFSTPIRA